MNAEAVKLPKPDERVMLTGLFAGLFSQHVCVVPDATDEEILKVCNDYEGVVNPSTWHRWTIVVRDEAAADRANIKWEDAKPGQCVECPPRIHMVVR